MIVAGVGSVCGREEEDTIYKIRSLLRLRMCKVTM